MGARFNNDKQGSDGWKLARCGHATASRFADIIAGKGQREAYMWQLVGERSIGGPLRDSGGMAKDWGHGSEPLFRREYMARTGNLVREVGFAQHARIKWVGASSDGLVIGQNGGIEGKSPFNSGIHARTLSKGMPDAHHWQVQGNCWVLELDWVDFLSYDPAFPAPHDLFIQHVKRNERDIKFLQQEVKKFLAEVQVACNEIQTTNLKEMTQ